MISIDERLSESVPVHHYWFQFPFFTRRYNVLWEHHKFIGLIGQVTYYQNLNVSTREKTTLTTQINSDCHITWLSLILIDYLEKDRNSNWEQRCSKHNRIGFGTCITVYIYVPYTSENQLLFRTSAVQLDL